MHTSTYRMHIWQERFAEQGRARLVNRPRRGQAPKLGAVDQRFIELALEQGPQASFSAWHVPPQMKHSTVADAGSTAASERGP